MKKYLYISVRISKTDGCNLNGGEHCENTSHNCPICFQPRHVLCGIPAEEGYGVYCRSCLDSRKSNEENKIAHQAQDICKDVASHSSNKREHGTDEQALDCKSPVASTTACQTEDGYNDCSLQTSNDKEHRTEEQSSDCTSPVALPNAREADGVRKKDHEGTPSSGIYKEGCLPSCKSVFE